MPPQSRGKHLKPPPVPTGLHSKSTPNLPTLRNLTSTTNGTDSSTNNASADPTFSPDMITSPSEPASLEDFSLDPASDSGDSEEEQRNPIGSLTSTRNGIYHQHSRSHTYLAPSAFAPPFYNRPPTPLPPSPSLTSLLRPTFSSQNSRPATPDPSSDEGGTPTTRPVTAGTQTPNSAAAASTLTSSYRTAKPIPRASPKVPTYEYYGFTLYLTSSLTFLVYLLWSFLPSPFLHQLGIYYFPDRWWALAIPAWTVMFMVYIYAALASYNTGYLTLPMGSVECLVDEAANVAVVDAKGRIVRDDRPSWGRESVKGARGGRRYGGHSRQSSYTKSSGLVPEVDWRGLWNEGTDAVMDIPVGGVCEILYGQAETERGA